jgi:hypothetical protein
MAGESFDDYVEGHKINTQSVSGMLIALMSLQRPFRPFVSIYEFEQAIVNLSPKHPVGFLAIVFEGLRRYFPALYERARYGDVIVSRASRIRSDEPYPQPPQPPGSDAAYRVALDVLYRERPLPIVCIGDARFEPYIGRYKTSAQSHPAVTHFNPWEAIAAYSLTATAQMYGDPDTAIALVHSAVDICPLSVHADFLPRLYRAAGHTDEYKRSLHVCGVRPFAGNFLRKRQLDQDTVHERAAIDRYGYTRWAYIKSHLLTYADHYAL